MDGESDAKTSVKKSKKGGHKDGADGNAVFVRGLGTAATGEQLESFFSSVGPIRRSFVVTDGGTQPKCTGVGFVHFALREDAKKAIDFMQGAALGGRKLRLDFARRRLRAGDGPADGAEDADGGLRPKRARAHPGTRPPPAPVKGALSGSLGMRTVVVKSRDETQPLDEAAVLAMLGGDAESGFESVIVGATGDNARFVFQSWPHAGRAAAKIHGEQYDAFIDALRGGKKCKLIVRNLPFKVTQSEFRKVFTDIAPVREVSLPPPKDEKAKESLKAEDGKEVPVRCRGFGFVEYFLAADANRAITKLNGTKIGGRIVAVDLAIGKAAFILKTAEEEEEEAKEREAQEAEEKHAEEDTVKEEAEANDKEDAAPKPEPKRGKSTPEEMNRTVFIRNLLYETSATELWQAMEERFGPVEQAVIVKDPMTGRPRGTAFVRFASAEGVDAAITPSADSSSGKKTPATMNSSFSLQGRNLLIVRATNRERARDLVVDSSKKKEKNDTRNMRLAWIGHIKPDTPEARGMTEGDFAKRVKAEQDKRAKLSQNPNSFISETRLSVRNLPRFVDEKFLKQLFLASFRKSKETSKDGASKPKSFPKVTHTKVLRDPTRKDRSKGYGFIQFQEHRHALQALHKLNNNPGALEMLFKAKPKALALDDVKMSNYRKQWGGRRLIVEFSVEDKRQVAIIERVKEKGRAMKEAAILEKGDGDAKSRKSKKRKAPVGEKGQKRRKSDSEAQNTKSAKEDNINSVDSGKHKPQIGKSKEEVATDKGGSGPSKSPSDSGGKRRSKKRHVEETVNGNDEGAGRSKKKRRKKKKVEKDESDSKFDNMVAMYKKKLNKTAGQKWYDASAS